MEYYRCPIEDLWREVNRRKLGLPLRPRDELSEALASDDERRGSAATTVETVIQGGFVPLSINLGHTAEFGATVLANQLIDEKIIYWTMNTFFPTIQLFFESGRSCTIDGGQLPDARIGLDSALHFKLTDCAHEEDGRVTNSLLPPTHSGPGTGMAIKEAVIAQRTSIALQPIHPDDAKRWTELDRPHTRIATETHTVVGIRLRGMDRLAYIWAKVKNTPATKVWSNVRIAGLRNDVPVPNVWQPERPIKPGAEKTVVVKDSLITRDS
ncbi:hypothetical protein COCMIDRAFT_96265 [Bipolaris oryzae ATCC 44560]|uniref:Uncharacterized protein n=1 Tax=Bipolaris oryzae ATCC 44560 TaxID=930090 RepID=W6ZNR0_COCMI|nr:uncharacterized protein COCMIDRAFT_96265 [Bipolaris oryzae ATCC 44560]EUC45191.1 hypothetical protein COCMIDRAFT_96265 [Bipolaris oryzae ATCC 44560]